MITAEFLDELLSGYLGVTKDFKVEWGWDRYMVGGKMFAAICTPGEKYAEEYRGQKIITLKCEPIAAERLKKQYADILPGFYVDKRHWISVRLSGNLPNSLIEELCKSSYQLVFSKLTKKLQKEINGL